MATNVQPVQAVLRGQRLLEALAEAAGVGDGDLGVIELARRTGLSQSTTHRLLQTFGSEGYVAHDERTGRYRIGPRMFSLAAAAESQMLTLREQVAPAMEAMKLEFGETVNLTVIDRRHIVYVYQVESDRPVRAFTRVGNRVLAHASAAGKALLAHEPQTVLESMLSATALEALTPVTITSPAELLAHLRQVRTRGYALDLGEQDEDIVCVAAPILLPGRRPAGALSISGPAGRMGRIDLAAAGERIAERAALIFAARGDAA